MSIEIQGIHKRFGAFVALDDLNLTVPSGELVALLGPSGCGKTTLLRIIAGLEQADSGTVRCYGEDSTDRPIRERGVGFVFQHYALFQHLSVAENIAFGLRVRPRRQRLAEQQIQAKVAELLELVQLGGLAQRYPAQLSGGQRQRVALARALAVEPRLLLLDEPFGALDSQVRKELRRWLRQLHEALAVTSVFVTHDQEEAMEVADRVVVMNRGRLEQQGSPDEVYLRPASPFVYSFLGDVNLLHGRIHAGWADIHGLRLPVPDIEPNDEGAALAYVRPHEIELGRQPGNGSLPSVVQSLRLLGPVVRLLLQTDRDQALEVLLSRERYQHDPLQPGDSVHCYPRKLRVFPASVATPFAAQH